MSTPARRRLMRDLKNIQNDTPEGIYAMPLPTNLLLWHAIITGPDDTPFADGLFKLVLQFDESYPTRPPSIKFISKMFHPNIYADGNICLDLLQNRWSSSYDVAAMLRAIQSLLNDPNVNSPANGEAAEMYEKNKEEYKKRVRETVEETWNDDIGDALE